jgi:hypothetical protein
MLDEGLRQLRTGMAASLGLIVIWALALPATVDELRARQSAEHLATWLLLRSTFCELDGSPIRIAEFGDHFVSTSGNDSTIDADMKEPPPATADLRPGADNLPSPQPITIRTPWLGEKGDVTVSLHRWPPHIDKYKVYQVRSDAHFLPFDQYDIVLDTTGTCRDCVKVLAHQTWARGARDIDFTFHRQDEPKGWEDIRSRLWTHGTLGSQPTTLHLTDPAVFALVKEALSAQHAVWGFSLDSGLFFTAPGFLLGAQALLLLGPLLSLVRRRTDLSDQVWVLAMQTTFPRGAMLEALLMVVGMGWITLPLMILLAQLLQGVQLHPMERTCFWVGAVGLFLTAAANAVSMYQLRLLRRRP